MLVRALKCPVSTKLHTEITIFELRTSWILVTTAPWKLTITNPTNYVTATVNSCILWDFNLVRADRWSMFIQGTDQTSTYLQFANPLTNNNNNNNDWIGWQTQNYLCHKSSENEGVKLLGNKLQFAATLQCSATFKFTLTPFTWCTLEIHVTLKLDSHLSQSPKSIKLTEGVVCRF